MNLIVRLFALVWLAFAFVVSLSAHEIRPAIFALELQPDGAFTMKTTLNLEAYLANIGSEVTDTSASPNARSYDTLRAGGPELVAQEFEKLKADFLRGISLGSPAIDQSLVVENVLVPEVGDVSQVRISTVIIRGNIAGNDQLIWRADGRFGNTVLRVAEAGQSKPFFAVYLRPAEASKSISLATKPQVSLLASLWRYLTVGFTHILPGGLDHVLFVVGLFLLSARLRPLLMQITSFTVAHTITLALGILGIVNISPAIVEPLIALSIAFVAIENMFTDRLQTWRPYVVFGFGLLHGLGFAGVLTEIGLPRNEFLTGLIGFNLGVECGQLAVISICFALVGYWFRDRPWYRKAITIPASLVIAMIACYWVVERTFA